MNTKKYELTDSEKELVNISLDRHWATPLFKIKNFIGNAEVTHFGTMRQFLLELRAREELIESAEYQIECYKIKIEIAENKNTDEMTFEERKLHELLILELKKDLKITERRLVVGLKERKDFATLIEQMNEKEEGISASGKKILDILKEEGSEEEELEAEYWKYRLAKQASLDMLAHGRIAAANYDAITQLGPEKIGEVLEIATSYAFQNEKVMNSITDYVKNSLTEQENKELVSGFELKEIEY